MCTTCGCGHGETRIEGHEHSHAHEHHEHAHGHAHAHEYRHADGTVHTHTHVHVCEHHHDHDAAHSAYGAVHEHTHRHADGTVHSHPHAHDESSAHGVLQDYDQTHVNVSANEHLHYGLGLAGAHAPGMSQARMVQIEQDILGTNNACAAANRRYFGERGIFALNLVSSPGSGKTTLLTRTIEALRRTLPLAVIEGDQQTANDAERIRASGARAIQINTGKGCHLDAHMVGRALERLTPAEDSVLMIENVGNLVCPAAFDLGEAHKVLILSVTEGEDKPLKYPDMFHAASLMLLNKIDLLPHLRFDAQRCIEYARRINPTMQVICISATSGEGMDEWLQWLREGAAAAAARRRQTVQALQARVRELEAQLAEKPGT